MNKSAICIYFFLIYSIRVGSTYDIASGAGVLWTVEIVPICKYIPWYFWNEKEYVLIFHTLNL